MRTGRIKYILTSVVVKLLLSLVMVIKKTYSLVIVIKKGVFPSDGYKQTYEKTESQKAEKKFEPSPANSQGSESSESSAILL